MHRRRVVRWSTLAAVLAAALGAGAVQAIRWHDRQIARAACEAGRQIGISEAEVDLAAGTPRYYVTGERSPHQPEYDPTSGLPIKAVAACLVTAADLGRAAGYNDAVGEWRRRHGAGPGAGVLTGQ